MATRKDVAKLAGVSTATVSHVINNSKFVSDDLKQKVMEAVNKTGYRPNIIARSLSTKRTHHVGIVVSDITNPYFSEIAKGMNEVARLNGYIVSLFIANENVDEFCQDVIQRQMDGLLVVTNNYNFTNNQMKLLNENNVCFVNAGWPEYGSLVCCDYMNAVDKVIKYLSDLGHTKIAFMSGSDIENPNNDRYKSYKSAMIKYCGSYEDSFVARGNYDYNLQSGYSAMQMLLNKRNDITAVFCSNDLMAIGAIQRIKESGMEVPKDISVVGCDNIMFSSYLNPSLTTIDVPKLEMGRQAMKLMLRLINKNTPEMVSLGLDLVVRESTARVRR